MKLSFYDWCIKNNRNDLLDRWDYELNKKCPKDVSCQCADAFYFKCEKYENHHSHTARINHLIRGLAPLECDECSSFAQWCNENLSDSYTDDYWHFDINTGINPYTLNAKSKKRITLKCNNGFPHTYEISPRSFIAGDHSCTVCKNKIVLPGFNDLFTSNPELKSIWNFDKNIDMSPNEVTFGSNKKVWWKCDICGHEWDASVSNVSKGSRCPKCAAAIIGGKHRKLEDVFLDQMKSINPNIIILGEYTGSNERILCECAIDGHIWTSYPTHLLRGVGCPVCCNRVVVKGINDIATTRSDLVQYFKDKNDAFKYSKNASGKIDVVCPICGYEKSIYIQHLTNSGFGCPICGDGVSYPNKFCRAFLKQLPISTLLCEWNPDWAKPYFYDNYFEYNGNKIIIEVDGLQHFETVNSTWKSADETQLIDSIKDQLAKENNIDVIRIDCRKSNVEYISNSILRSALSGIFDLSIIDWNKCDVFAMKSLVYSVCDFYNKNYGVTWKNIASEFNLSPTTIGRYLKIGRTIGLIVQHAKIS